MGLFGKKKGVASPQVEVAPQVASTADAELIAVISAAIAAYESEGVVSDLIIRKIDRTAGVIPAWGVAGNRETIDSRM